MGVHLQGETDETAMSDINVTPLVDVMLVLLIISMVAAPMLQRSINLELPATETASEIQEAASEFRQAIVSLPWTARALVGLWRERKNAGRVSSKLSEWYGSVDRQEIGERVDACLEQVERRVHHSLLALHISRRAERPTHRVLSDDHPRQPHFHGNVAESRNEHRDRWNARLLDQPRDVPDRHVTHRSHGNEEYSVDRITLQLRHPLGRRLFAKPALRRGSGKAVEAVRYLTDTAVRGRIEHAVARQRDVVILGDTADVVATMAHPQVLCGEVPIDNRQVGSRPQEL